jgi:hypothetical protein
MRSVYALTFCACSLLFALIPCPAAAQGRFGLGVALGPSAPLSAAARNVVRLDVAAVEADAALGIPSLERWSNRLGVRAAASAHLGPVEIRYSYDRFSWRERTIECVGDRLAAQLPNGEVSDGEVRYQCADNPESVTLRNDALPPLRLHHLSIGPRIYLRRSPDMGDDPTSNRPRAAFYAAGLVGPTLAQYSVPGLGAILRAGGHLSIAGGTEIPIERNLFLTLDVRYTASFVGGAATPSARAGRAIATGRGVGGALLDGFHQVGATFGVRVNFR